MTRPLDVKIGRAGMWSLRRVVVRLEPLTVVRVDMLLPRWKGAKRAEVLRALILRGLDAIDAPQVPDEQCVHPVIDYLNRAKTCAARAYLQREVEGCGLHWFCPDHARAYDERMKREASEKGGA